MRDEQGARALLDAMLPVLRGYTGPNPAIRPGWVVDTEEPGRLWYRSTEAKLDVEETARVARPSLRSLNLARNTLCGTLQKNVSDNSWGATLEQRMVSVEQTGSSPTRRYGYSRECVLPSEELQERLSFVDANQRRR